MVPSLSSGNQAVRLRHYIMFRNTRFLFPLHLLLVCHPPFITKPYDSLLPPAHNFQGSWLPLLRYHNVKNRPCSNVLGRNVVTAGNVLPNFPQTQICQIIANGGVLLFSNMLLRHMDINLRHYLIMKSPNARKIWVVTKHNSNLKSNTDCTTVTQSLPDVMVPSPSNTNRQYNLTHFICAICRFLVVSVQSLSSYESTSPSYLNVSTFSRIQSQAQNSVPVAAQGTLAARWQQFFSTPSFKFWCKYFLPPMPPGVKTYHTDSIGGGGQCPCSG